MENLTYEEEKILKALGPGEENAITYKALAWRVNLPDREVRLTVAHLVTDHHICICTTSAGGYFLASNYSEFDHAHRELMARIKALSRRARGLRYGWEKIKKDEQLTLGV